MSRGSINHERSLFCQARVAGPGSRRQGWGTAVKLQPVTYRGRLVACATRTRYFLTEALGARPVGDPERTFVMFMCAYAADVLGGELEGPYSDVDARRYARAALVPEELADPQRRPLVHSRLRQTADALGLPVAELDLALAESAHRRRRSPR